MSRKTSLLDLLLENTRSIDLNKLAERANKSHEREMIRMGLKDPVSRKKKK